MADKFLGGVRPGQTDVSIAAFFRSLTDNSELTGLLATDINASYWRQGGSRVAITASDLTAVDDPHSDGGFFETDTTNMPGLYRFDVPDAAFAAGADWVVVTITATGAFVYVERFNLTRELAAPGDQMDLVDAPNLIAVDAIALPVMNRIGDPENENSYAGIETGQNLLTRLANISHQILSTNFLGNNVLDRATFNLVNTVGVFADANQFAVLKSCHFGQWNSKYTYSTTLLCTLQDSVLTLGDVARSEREHNGENYYCIRSHRSSPSSEPGIGPQWTDFWSVGGAGGSAWQLNQNNTRGWDASAPSTTPDALRFELDASGSANNIPPMEWEVYSIGEVVFRFRTPLVPAGTIFRTLLGANYTKGLLETSGLGGSFAISNQYLNTVNLVAIDENPTNNNSAELHLKQLTVIHDGAGADAVKFMNTATDSNGGVGLRIQSSDGNAVLLNAQPTAGASVVSIVNESDANGIRILTGEGDGININATGAGNGVVIQGNYGMQIKAAGSGNGIRIASTLEASAPLIIIHDTLGSQIGFGGRDEGAQQNGVVEVTAGLAGPGVVIQTTDGHGINIDANGGGSIRSIQMTKDISASTVPSFKLMEAMDRAYLFFRSGVMNKISFMDATDLTGVSVSPPGALAGKTITFRAFNPDQLQANRYVTLGTYDENNGWQKDAGWTVAIEKGFVLQIDVSSGSASTALTLNFTVSYLNNDYTRNFSLQIPYLDGISAKEYGLTMNGLISESLDGAGNFQVASGGVSLADIEASQWLLKSKTQNQNAVEVDTDGDVIVKTRRSDDLNLFESVATMRQARYVFKDFIGLWGLESTHNPAFTVVSITDLNGTPLDTTGMACAFSGVASETGFYLIGADPIGMWTPGGGFVNDVGFTNAYGGVLSLNFNGGDVTNLLNGFIFTFTVNLPIPHTYTITVPNGETHFVMLPTVFGYAIGYGGSGRMGQVAGGSDVNVVSIGGNPIDDYTATLRLRQLDIQSPDDVAFRARGGGANPGAQFEGGETGRGLELIGGPTSGDGMMIQAPSSGMGLRVLSTNGNPAVRFAGSGTGVGLAIHGGSTGDALLLQGGGISGRGAAIVTTDGHGVEVSSGGAGKVDILATKDVAITAITYNPDNTYNTITLADGRVITFTYAAGILQGVSYS